MMATSTSSPGTEAAPNLAWKWILEKLVDLPAFGLTSLNVVINRVPDIEEPHCQPLWERVALRYLEESVVSNQIDADAIPLLKALIRLEGGGRVSKVSSVKDRFNKELILRVQTEAVLSVLRKDIDNWQKDWEGFELKLKGVFMEEEDNRQLERQRELGTLLQPKNQTQTIVATCLERFCLKELKKDLSMFIHEKKASFNAIFLAELSKDFLLGKGPIFPEEPLTEKTTDADGRGKDRASCSVLLEDLEGGKVQVDTLQRQDIGVKTVLEVEQELNPEKCRDKQREDGHEEVPLNQRFKRKLLPSQQGSRNEDHGNPKEGNGGNKSRKSSIGPLISTDSPATCLRKRDDSGRAITKGSPSRGGVLPQGESELSKRCPTVVTDEEVGKIFKDLDSQPISRDGLHAPERSRPDQSRPDKRKLLPSQQGSGNEDHGNPKEGNGGNKSRKSSIGPLISTDSPATCLRKRDDSGRAIIKGSPSRGGVLPQGESELSKRCPTVVTDEEVGKIFKDLDSQPISRDGLHAPERSRPDQSKIPHKPSRGNKYVVHSDVDSDAETQVVQNLSSDDEDENLLREKCSRGGCPRKIDTSVRMENSGCVLTTKQGSGQERSQRIEARKGEKRDEIGHAKIDGNRRQERETVNLTYSPDTQKANENVEHHKMTKEDQIASLETQDSINLEFLDIGSDGHEDLCHNCGLNGRLLCCDGCPIAMHVKCVELLGLKLPRPKDDWFCPVCLLHKATREAAEAEKAAAEAKKKLKAFVRDSSKNRGLLEEDVLLQNRKENVIKKQEVRRDNPVPRSGKPERELARSSKPKHASDEIHLNSELLRTSDQPNSSHTATGINKALAQNQPHGPSVQLHVEHVENQVENPSAETTSFDAQGGASKQSCIQKDSFTAREILEGALKANDHILNATPHKIWVHSWNKDVLCGMEHNQKPVANDDTGKKVKKEETPQGRMSLTGKKVKEEERWRGGEALRMDLKASTSGDREREQVIVAPVVERRRSALERGQDTAEQRAGVREQGQSHEVAAEVEGDKHDGDLEEDCGGKLEGSRRRPLLSGRRRIPGLRRKALHWTRAEEDALKRGVKRYSQNGVHGFQWTRILESGFGIFDPSRTDVDLKDKWRNLVKGVS